MSYRFRVGEGGALVLQLAFYEPRNRYSYDSTSELKWRDATVEDIPVFDPFKAPVAEPNAMWVGQQMATEGQYRDG